MRSHGLLLGSALALAAGCSLDPTGAAPIEDGDGGSGPATSTGPTTGPGTTGSTGATTGPGSGGGPGAGGGSTSSAGGDGGGGSTSASGGGGGAGGGTGGSGGAGGAGGSGGAGGTGGAGGAGGSGGEGGSGGYCGDGVVDAALNEECDEDDPLECDPTSCTWLAECALSRHVASTPGGLQGPGDTSIDPTATDFGGACSDNGSGGVDLITYTTGDASSWVEVVVFHDGGFGGLADPILSLHTSCADDAEHLCVIHPGQEASGCCTDRDAFQTEVLLTDLLPPGTSVTVAIGGYLGEEGAYEVRVREYVELAHDDFAGGPSLFTATGSANTWRPVSGAGCVDDGECLAVPDDGQNHDAEVLTSGSIDASGAANVLMRWANVVDDNGGNLNDRQRIEMSLDGGAWTEIYSNSGDEAVYRNLVLPGAGGIADVRVRFLFEDGGGSTNYWYLDEVYFLAF